MSVRWGRVVCVRVCVYLCVGVVCRVSCVVYDVWRGVKDDYIVPNKQRPQPKIKEIITGSLKLYRTASSILVA